jgi:hypothetical protein
MAKSSASFARGKTSGVATTTGLREASPNPRDVANMPDAESASGWDFGGKHLTINAPDAVKNDATTCLKNAGLLIGLIWFVISGNLHYRVLLYEDSSAVSSVGNPYVVAPHKARGGCASILCTLMNNVS